MVILLRKKPKDSIKMRDDVKRVENLALEAFQLLRDAEGVQDLVPPHVYVFFS